MKAVNKTIYGNPKKLNDTRFIWALTSLSLAACAPASQLYGIQLPANYPLFDCSDAYDKRQCVSKLSNADLAMLALAQDKHAQLELGIRFEEGRHLPKDLKRARNLYQLAAQDSYSEVTVYEAASEVGEPAIIKFEKSVITQRGLIVARDRLKALKDPGSLK
ncbi:hypothetical protein [Erythrobacter sp.]|uniref:SEL1-like repeat protein n=1 Tax=Erythrobacter sp. TaxID=1042 RepID=UPI003C734CE4